MPRVILGSASPRRRRLLEEDGWEVLQRPPAIDDGEFPLVGATPEATVEALAWFKGAQMEDAFDDRDPEVIAAVAADTVCDRDGRVLGKPRTPREARAMIGSLAGRTHRTLTGTCVLVPDGARRLFVDTTLVTMDPIPEAWIDDYVSSGEWRGKAGGYNLADRVAAGWPIRVEGDPSTVMGLPMRRLSPWLHALVRPDEADPGSAGGEEEAS